MFTATGSASGLLLLASIGVVSVLHTMAPDHWVPLTLIARQQGWTRDETAVMAAGAGTGHVVTTLAIGLLAWAAGFLALSRIANHIGLFSSAALLLVGGWIAIAGFRRLRQPSEDYRLPSSGYTKVTLLLLLGSSPMLEGIPFFLAGAKFGAGMLLMMSFVFAACSVVTYVALCMISTNGILRLRLGAMDQYLESASGCLIFSLGAASLIWQSV